MSLMVKSITIGGMTCQNCQSKIERALRATQGIKSARVSYKTGIAEIEYEPGKVTPDEISAKISGLGYTVLAQSSRVLRGSIILVAIAALYALLERSNLLNTLVPGRLADTQMGYGMLFIIGLVTSVHCIAMCGGINLSQCLPRGTEVDGGRFSAFIPALLYNLGRVISYTATGFILGLVGMIFGGGGDSGLPVFAQGILKLGAGLFMVIMGISMLGLFPRFGNLRLPFFFTNSKSPLIVGLINGLMPCGPLQSMQIVALASGNPVAGALSMLLFSLGTVPLMLGLGSAVSAIGKRFAGKVMSVGAVLVVVLGLAMVSQGANLSGIIPQGILIPSIFALCAVFAIAGLSNVKPLLKMTAVLAAVSIAVVAIALWTRPNIQPSPSAATEPQQTDNSAQTITSTLKPSRYPDITVKAGTPVKWIIEAPMGSINGCNNRMLIQDLNITHSFQIGENIIEFTPEKPTTIAYSCWMGMITGTITVTDGDT